MPEVFSLPHRLADHFTNPGLEADAGFIHMNQYVPRRPGGRGRTS